MHCRPFARFLRWFGALLGSYLVFTAVLSTTVDPWRINAAPWALAALDPAREICQTTRVGKAAIANRGIWRAAIFGSSRLEIGLDPTHPALPPPCPAPTCWRIWRWPTTRSSATRNSRR